MKTIMAIDTTMAKTTTATLNMSKKLNWPTIGIGDSVGV
jgi:hypothetical protein